MNLIGHKTYISKKFTTWFFVLLIVGSTFLVIGISFHFGYPSVIGIIVASMPLLMYSLAHFSGIIQQASKTNLINVFFAFTYASMLLTVAVLVIFYRRDVNSILDVDSHAMLSIAAMITLNSVGLYLYFMVKAIMFNKETNENNKNEERYM